MFILPHFLKDLLKNKLQLVLNAFHSALLDDIVDVLSSPSPNKYFLLLSSLQEQTKLLIISTLKEILETMDIQFKNSENRKLFYNISKSNIPRTITTLFGDVTFSRTYYISKVDSSLHFVLDETLGLPKYDRYDPIIKGFAISNSVKTNQALAGEITGELLTSLSSLGINDAIKTIPRQSVFNWINSWQNPKLTFEPKETPDTLYIMADEKFIGCQDSDKDIMIKSFVVFEGIKQVSKGRNELINRTIINLVSTKPWIDFSDILFQLYDSQKVKKIYLLGDGASWIKSGLSELKMEHNMEVKHLLCEFHFKQSLHHITTDEQERQELLRSFQEDSKKQFQSYVETIKQNNPQRAEIIEKKEKYIMNNYNAIKDMLKSNIGSSMESHISHYVANQFGSRPKGYSTKHIDKYLEISNFYNNKFNLFQLYLRSYNNEKQIEWKEKSLEYSLFDKKGSNIPVIENGRCSSLYQSLNGLAHNSII